LEREIRELNGTLTTADKAAGLFKNSLGQIAAGNLIADAIGAIVEKVKDHGATVHRLHRPARHVPPCVERRL
jgi:hypothetical protein